MGTRNVTAVMIDGEYKVAQYGQWDGYPSGQGVDALRILKEVDLDKLAEAVRNCTWITKEAHEEHYIECGAERGAQWITMEVSDEFKKRFPELSRDTGAKVLKIILEKNGCKLADNITSATSDDSWCEFVWCVDFDKRTFEGYSTWSAYSESSERFPPFNLIKVYSLDDLPSEEQFLAECEPKDEDEDEDEEDDEE